MSFRRLINFLYTERLGTLDDFGHVITSEVHFAEYLGVVPGTLIGWMKGHQHPELDTIAKVLKRSGYPLDDCIDIPESRREGVRRKHPELFDSAEAICLTENQDRIAAATKMLADSAIAATIEKRTGRQKEIRKNRQAQGHLKRRIRKKIEAG